MPGAGREIGRQGCRRILHPPFAVCVAFEFGDRRVGVEPHPSPSATQCPRVFSAQPAASLLTLRSSVGSRAMRQGDRARDGLAIVYAPALGEPRRRVVVEGIGTGQDLIAIADDCPQDRISESGEGSARRFGARRLHRKVDRRMVGRFEKQDLSRGDDERPFQRAAALGHACFQPPRQRLADRAESAERHRCDRARQPAVPGVERASLLGEIGGQPLFERPR